MPKPPKPAEKKPLREPDAREKAAMDRALERYKGRPAPLEYSVSTTPDGRSDIKRPHSDAAGHLLHGLDTFGTASAEFKNNAICQLGSVLREQGQDLISEQELNAGLAAISGIAPENEVEAMLAVQMVATHDVAMKALRKLAYTSEVDRMEKFGNIATKMMRTYTTQLEALAKLRRGGEQTVRVEHVHVYHGGQAIVGNVQRGGAPGGILKMEANPMHSLARQPTPFRLAPRCCARTRQGIECQSPAVSGKRRCRMHGGARGSGAPRGSRNGSYTLGLWTQEMQELRAEARAVMAESRRVLRQMAAR